MEAKTIKKLRKEQGLTQEQLGNAIGASQTYIADLESGRRDINNISARTLVRLADMLGTSAEYIINPPAHLDDTDFEWDKVYNNNNNNDDYFLIVDGIAWSKKLNQHIFCIDGLWYHKVGSNPFNKSVPIDRQLVLLKSVSENLKSDKGYNYDYYMYKCVPRGGFDVKIRREITQSELDEIIKRYKLTEDDISNEFVDKVGDIYGKYRKTYTSIQIRVNVDEAILLESDLRQKGIEAANGAPGRVNIRVK